MEWISTKDKLPEIGVTVLAVFDFSDPPFDSEPHIETTERFDGWGPGWLWRYLDRSHAPSAAKYWMPLPELPKGAK